MNRGDLIGRLAIIGCYGWQAARLIEQWVITGRISGPLFLLGGALVVYFTAVRRPATRIDQSAGARALAVIGTLAPTAFRPAPMILPDPVTAVIVLSGFFCALCAILALGRNFGIVAAHRGVSQTGPYGVVRHPIYAAYCLMHVGIVCANFSVWNLGVWVVAEAAQIGRVLYEERVLRHETAYSKYALRVRWRLVPGVF
jgi:protein-S-isoprenylcysteine O-methyltransferase Ste14